MQEMFLGEVIRQRRLELGLTQEQLCEGICEPVTISRMENGKQTPSRSRVMALLQRLGLPDDRYYALLNKKELELDALQKEVVSCNVRYEHASQEERARVREEALKAVGRLERAMEQDDSISRQIVLRSRLLLGKEDGKYDFEEQIQMLTEAIRLTVPRFDPEEIGACLYSYDEIKIINQIANTYSRFGQHKKAVDIFSQLLKYIQKHAKLVSSTKAHLPMVAFNYAREMGILKRYEDAIEVAELGRQACVNYGHYSELPSLLAVIAECRHFLGEDTESMSLYHQVYYLCRAIGNESGREIAQAEFKQYFHKAITD